MRLSEPQSLRERHRYTLVMGIKSMTIAVKPLYRVTGHDTFEAPGPDCAGEFVIATFEDQASAVEAAKGLHQNSFATRVLDSDGVEVFRAR